MQLTNFTNKSGFRDLDDSEIILISGGFGGDPECRDFDPGQVGPIDITVSPNGVQVSGQLGGSTIASGELGPSFSLESLTVEQELNDQISAIAMYDFDS